MHIKSVHGFNFRSLGDAVIDLSHEGLTVLAGPPGAGKSSLFGLIPWVLFGDTGAFGSLQDLRRRGANDKDRAGGTVTFTHDGDTITATRWIIRSRPKGEIKESAKATLAINGEQLEGITPTRLTAEVGRILGMNAHAFRGANFIGQGEVDTLATSTPTEVQTLVEHHTGLATLTKARQAARDAARDAANTASVLPGDRDTLTTAINTRDEHHATHKKLNELAIQSRRKADSDLAAMQRADTELRELTTADRAARASREAVVAADAVAARETARLDDLRSSHGGLDTSTGAVAKLDAALADAEARRSALRDAGAAFTHATAHAGRTQDAAAHARNRADGHDLASIADNRRAVDADLARIAAEGKAAAERIGRAGGEVNRLDKALRGLRDAEPDAACCPTCQQGVDNFAGLIAELQRDRDHASDELASATSDRDNADRDYRDGRAKQHELEQLDSEAKSARDAADAAAAAAHEASEAAREAEQQLRAFLDVPADTAANTLADAGRDADKQLGKELEELRGRRSAIDAIVAAQHAADTARADADTARTNTVEAPDPEAISAAEAALAQAQQVHSESDELRRSRDDELHESDIVLMQLESSVSTEQAKWDDKQAALREAEVAAGVADSISALRADLLAEYTSHISAAASELLSRFGGEHVAFHLDGDFVPRVELADGTLVETRTLSGGEKARAGLAFRLGITMQITRGGIPAHILGDEVTNYLDEDGRRAVIAALQGLFPHVTLVSHTSEALDHAGSIVMLERDPLGETVIAADGEEPLDLDKAG